MDGADQRTADDRGTRLSKDELYSKHGDIYHSLRQCQDLKATVVPLLGELPEPSRCPLSDCEVAELGVGTGPLTLALVPEVKSLVGYDVMPHMLETARGTLERTPFRNWRLEVGDHRSLPAADDSADLVIAGWTISPMVAREWSNDWQAAVDTAVAANPRPWNNQFSTRAAF